MVVLLVFQITPGTAVVIAATALGADLIENILKIDNKCSSPDAPFSITPPALKKMISDIKM